MLLQTHDIVTIVTAVAIMLLVVVLSLLHIESGSRWYQLHRARRYLALASAVIAITGILGIILGRQNVGWELVSSYTFFVGMIQYDIHIHLYMDGASRISGPYAHHCYVAGLCHRRRRCRSLVCVFAGGLCCLAMGLVWSLCRPDGRILYALCARVSRRQATYRQ